MEKVKVINDSFATVGYSDPNHIVPRREFPIGAVFEISLEELKQAFTVKGVKSLFDTQYLLIEDEDIREQLGLPIRHAKYDASRVELTQLIHEWSSEELEDYLSYCSDSRLNIIFHIACAEVVEIPKAKLISQYTGIDVLSVIEEREYMKNNSVSRGTDNSGRTKRKPKNI